MKKPSKSATKQQNNKYRKGLRNAPKIENKKTGRMVSVYGEAGKKIIMKELAKTINMVGLKNQGAKYNKKKANEFKGLTKKLQRKNKSPTKKSNCGCPLQNNKPTVVRKSLESSIPVGRRKLAAMLARGKKMRANAKVHGMANIEKVIPGNKKIYKAAPKGYKRNRMTKRIYKELPNGFIRTNNGRRLKIGSNKHREYMAKQAQEKALKNAGLI